MTATASSDPIGHESNGSKGAFFISRGGRRVAEMTYSRGGKVTIIDHTQVDDSMRGTGAGRRLVEAAVQWARQDQVRLLPLCPFARSVFEKTPEWADVLVQR